MQPADVVLPTPNGIYCKLGDFHIDPTTPVDRAVITHAHSDHARPGHANVLATAETIELMRLRYGDDFAGSAQPLAYGETLRIGNVRLTLYPAGHVLGSAQVLIEADSLRIAASGDYKNVRDPTCAPLDPIPCDLFITEATFGLPIFRHGAPAVEIKKLLHSVALFPERAHLVGAYRLGKAQRLIALLRDAGYDKLIFLHGAMEKITGYYQHRGIELGAVQRVGAVRRSDLAGSITLCPPEALHEIWSRRFPDPVTSIASGWMRVRARARQHRIELPLVISDHADWAGLTSTIASTGASEVWVTHGQEDALVHWSLRQGLRARPLEIIGYGDPDEADGSGDSNDPAR
jgi:putative mRNA 3-end processing factor